MSLIEKKKQKNKKQQNTAETMYFIYEQGTIFLCKKILHLQ